MITVNFFSKALLLEIIKYAFMHGIQGRPDVEICLFAIRFFGTYPADITHG